MRVSGVHSSVLMNNFYNKAKKKDDNDFHQNDFRFSKTQPFYSKAGLYNIYNVSFGEKFGRHRSVPDIEFEEYKQMSDTQKKYFRKRYELFQYKIDIKELFDPSDCVLPLRSEKNMEDFLKVVKFYNQFKNDNIICLGRSPKWFLNASLWMKDGIDDYKFVAFSGYWFFPSPSGYVRKIDIMEPKEESIKAYRKYLKSIKADPKSIINEYNKNGKKTIITDYVFTGKGMTSFLDIMSNYAYDEGILDDFAKSIKLVGIGSMDYIEERNPYADEISEPNVVMPPKLLPYSRALSTQFYNMPYPVFREMLLNQNTNECRSTYYPSSNWTLYKPNKFKTGLIKDIQKVKDIMKLSCKKTVSSFQPAMQDFRNLLNFRILDALYSRNLLKTVHTTKK